MLLDQERKQILSSIRYGYRPYNPVDLDVSSGELHYWSVSLWRRIICWLSYAFLVCHMVFKGLRLVQTFVHEKEKTKLFEFIIHIDLACGMVVGASSYYFLFIQNPDVHAAIVKFSFSPRTREGNYTYGNNP